MVSLTNGHSVVLVVDFLSERERTDSVQKSFADY